MVCPQYLLLCIEGAKNLSLASLEVVVTKARKGGDENLL